MHETKRLIYDKNTPAAAATRVLLVEDSPEDAELIRRALLKASCAAFELRHVVRFRDAVACAGDHFDVILLDLSLPDGSGVLLLQDLRRVFDTTPVVVLTGLSDETLAIEAVRSGAQDYLLKGQASLDHLGRALVYAIERHRSQVRLQQSEAQLADAQALAHLGSWEWDSATDVSVWSLEMYRILGLEPGACQPSRELFRSLVHPDEQARHRASSEQAIARLGPFNFEGRIVRPSGEVRAVLSSGTILREANRNGLRMSGTLLDITDRKQLEEQLIVAGRMAAVGTLASGIAHEINNPLAAVLANLEIIERDVAALAHEGGGNELHRALEDARQGAQRIRDIVQKLKVFIRGGDETREVLNLLRLVESSINVAWSEIRYLGRLVTELGEVPAVEASAGLLSQALVHLLVNAAQSLPGDRVDQHEIRVRTYADASGQAVVEVKDNGTGIRPEHIDRIFDPFFTTKPIGKALGLGLTSAHAIVSAVGGEIRVESEPGKGSVFRVALPAAKPRPAVPAPDAAGLASGQRSRILVIDDDELVGNVLRRLLVSDYDVVVETRARAALARIEQAEAFDLILCDLMMPDMTGMDFFEELETRKSDLVARTIFISGGAFTPRASEFLERVPNARLQKPFHVERVLALVRDSIR